MADNPNSRLEVFCHGVFAIALTLLIIDIKVPVIDTAASNSDMWMAIEAILPNNLRFS